ncbi:2OG-Fe(II) oxygenase family protein [Luminiphilus sp.]|nr:2OG-Fe(II) oxygenase family protein [Luminiphilus sp.]
MTTLRHQTVSLDEVLSVAHISMEGGLVFGALEELDSAWDLGIFYLKIPDDLDIERARQFGRSLCAPSSHFRQIPKYGELEGFISLENNQQTKLALRRFHWDKHYPAEIAEFGRQLDKIGIAIILEVLRLSGISESLWTRASGGYSSGEGTAFLNFVHYDTRNSHQGLRPHTDYGFVTLLDTTTRGLQIKVNGEFVEVPVRPGHLAVHFGEALNFITRYSNRPVAAIEHRVIGQKSIDPIRHGIVYFANPDLDGMLWQFDADGGVKGSSSVQDLFTLLEKNLTE